METDVNISMTEKAAKRINMIASKQSENKLLRIAVLGGGCSGFQYHYELVKDQENDDIVLQKDGATILIDPVSVQFMENSEIDFVDDLIGQSFQIRNPNAVASCGCGTSFSV